MIKSLIPNTLIYLYNYIKYQIVYPQAIVSPKSFLSNTRLGKNVLVSGGIYLNDCQVGDYSYIAGNEAGGIISGFHHTTIGKYCSIGNHIEMLSESSHDYTKDFQYPFYSMSNSPLFDQVKAKKETKISPILIGNDVWIGTNVIVLGGTTIGDGAVIGAGSVVTKNVPPYAIVVGSPARVIKKRFSQEKILKLLNKKWWNLPVSQLKKYVSHS